MSDIDILLEFTQRTGVCSITPDDYWTSDTLTHVRPHLLNSLQDLSEETIVGWMGAILNAADVPADLRGVLAGEFVLRYLLEWHLHNSLVQDPSGAAPESHPWELDPLITPIAHRVCDALFDRLHGLAPHRTVPLTQIPWQKDAEIFSFHLKAFPHTRRQPCALYQTCGPLLGVRLLQLNKRCEPETEKWYATAPRTLFKHFQHNSLTAPIVPLTRERFLKLIELSHQEFARHLRRSDDPSAIIQSHQDRLIWLYDARPVGSRKYGGRSEADTAHTTQDAAHHRDSKPLEDLPPDTPPDDLTVASLRPLAVEEVVDFEDWNKHSEQNEGDRSELLERDPLIRPPLIWVAPPSQSTVSRRPSLSPEDTWRAIGHNFPRFWDPLRGGLGPHRLCAWLTQVNVWYQAGIRDGRLLFPLLPIWYGWDRYDLTEMQIDTYPVDEDNPTIPRDRLLFDPWRRHFFYFQTKAQGRSSFQPACPEGWRPSTRWIAIPVARALTKLIAVNIEFLRSHGLLRNGQRFLQILDAHGAAVPLTPRHFEYIVQQVLS